MKIFGLDFTSFPSARKPITFARGYSNKNGPLIIEDVETFNDFSKFEDFLNSKGPWVAGFDFPFGLPSTFIHALKLKKKWASYVETIGSWTKEFFDSSVTSFKKNRPKGKKEPFRITDSLVGAKSPLKQFNPPLTKMFFQGAPRLLRSEVSIIPCRPCKDNRTALETYPVKLARLFAKVYKNDGSKGNLSSMKKARETIINSIVSEGMNKKLGFKIRLNNRLKLLAIEEGKGDILDAILCAVQARWAWSKGKPKYGISGEINETVALEGWIIGYHQCSPNSLTHKTSSSRPAKLI